MQNPFKKGPSKEQKREAKRRWAIIKEQVYPILLEDCENVNEMKHRLESTLHAIQHELVNKVETFKKGLEEGLLATWHVEPLKGKGEKVEQKLLDVLGVESVKVVDELLTHLPRIIDSFVYEEMGKREPKSLEVKFPE